MRMAELAVGRKAPAFTLTDQDGKTYHPEAIIIASGASLRRKGSHFPATRAAG